MIATVNYYPEAAATLFLHTEKPLSESCKSKTNFECNYSFLIDLWICARNKVPFAVPNWNLQSKLGLI